MKEKLYYYYYLVNYIYTVNGNTGDGRAFISHAKEIESFDDIMDIESLIKQNCSFDDVAIKSFQPLKYGYKIERSDADDVKAYS